MKRKPTFLRSIGSVSSGTMRPEDLIPSFTWEMEHALKTLRIGRKDRKRYVALVNEANAIEDFDESDVDGVLDDLFDALDELAPPYCTFGANESDGACYGFWPCINDGNDELTRLVAGDEITRDHWGEDVLIVNERGNMECGHVDLRGRFHEFWSCV